MKNSKKLLAKATKLIPALSQTFSKAPYSYVEGVYPSYLSHGKGSHVFDVDGNEYIDYVMALGPIILGYSYPSVNKAIINQLKKGISFSIPHYLEVELSEKLNQLIPGAEMVRFSKTGSDAATGALRAARAHTKRDNVAYCGTGGVWHDWFTIITSRNKGIPKILQSMIRKFNYNDIESLKIIFEKWKGEVASVYMEPLFFEYPKKNFLRDVKKLCQKYGAVLIFDEVITGFRVANGGAQELLGIKSDLAVFGKGIANGMPLGAVTGKQEIMQEFNDVFFSTTYGGEALSLAASMAVINELQEKKVVKYCWELGRYMTSKFNKLADEVGINAKMEGLPVRSSIIFRDHSDKPSLLYKSLFYQETIKRGVLFGPGAVFFSYSHSKKDIDQTLDACETSMKTLKKAIEQRRERKLLKGKLMKPVMTF
ncbi:MAG: aminotransferase class III-fold pyridoxal phosphate-dependent enzyme [Candidatus Nitrosotenuis sp.]